MHISPQSVTVAAIQVADKAYKVYNDPKTQATLCVALAIISSVAGAYALAIGGLIHTIAGLGLLGNAVVVFNSRDLASHRKLNREFRVEIDNLKTENTTLKESVEQLRKIRTQMMGICLISKLQSKRLKTQIKEFREQNGALFTNLQRAEAIVARVEGFTGNYEQFFTIINKAIGDYAVIIERADTSTQAEAEITTQNRATLASLREVTRGSEASTIKMKDQCKKLAILANFNMNMLATMKRMQVYPTATHSATSRAVVVR